MNQVDQNAVVAATAIENSDAILNDLLGELDSNTSIDTVIAADASAGVSGAVDLLDDLSNLDDAVLESIEGDTGVIEATGAEVVEEVAEEVVIDAVDAIIEAANTDAEVVEPTAAPATTKKGGKKAGTKPAAKPAAKKGKKATTVPAGYGSDAESNVEGQIEAKDASEEVAAVEPKVAAPAAPAAPKPLRATSITHKPGDLLLVKLGSDVAADMLVFDDRHDGEQIQAAHADFIGRMNITNKDDKGYIADKVKDKMQMLLCWLAKGGDLNEVLKRTITLLHKDGKLTSGDKGNLHLNLLSKPYSAGTARSQGNQMFMALPELGMVVKGKGTMEPNPNSPLLQMAYATLGLSK